MNFNFSYVLQQAFRLLWKHKRLMLLNLPGSLLAGGFMLVFPVMFVSPFLAENEFVQRIADDPWPVFAAFLIIPLLFLIMTPVWIFTYTALIQGVAELEAGQDLGLIRDLLRRASPFFWRVAALTGIQMGASFLIGMLPMLLIVLTAGVAVICVGPLMPLLTPFTIVMSLVGVLSMHVVVIEKAAVVESIKIAWAQFKKAWLYLLGVSLVVFQVGGMAIGLIFAIPFMAVIPLSIALENSDPQTTGLLMGIGGLALLIFWPIATIAFLIYGSYTQTALALTYLEIRKSVPSPLSNDAPPSTIP
ncbi:MAG TPA: hypothetical protein PK530_08885 [Anaerolineales bacterium]|nr:hypothetical protein [Anaerolineales bacterium]